MHNNIFIINEYFSYLCRTKLELTFTSPNQVCASKLKLELCTDQVAPQFEKHIFYRETHNLVVLIFLLKMNVRHLIILEFESRHNNNNKFSVINMDLLSKL